MINTSIKQVVNLLKELKLCKGDTVLIHSNIASLGKVENGLKGIYDAIFHVVGNLGNIVVPTFSFSFCQDEVFDVEKTKSRVGVFTEFIRNLPGAQRSLHGITSFAGVGENIQNIIKLYDKTSYGPGSVPANLVNFNSKILQFGSPYISHTHYAEKLIGVPYRFDKYFKGKIKTHSDILNEKHSLYVRSEGKQIQKLIENDPRRIFFQSDKCNSVQYGYGTHRLFFVNDYIKFLVSKLKVNPFCLIDKELFDKDIT